MIWYLLAAFCRIQPAVPAELCAYVGKRDCTYHWVPLPNYVWRENSETTIVRQFSLNSQTWHGELWKHRIALVEPRSDVGPRGTATLVVTGGSMNDRDLELARKIANSSQMPVAVLFDIPNQPLFGLREDELIAHTFDKYLQTGDPSWPLLLPMVKSAVRAMDVIESATQGSRNPVTKFVVTGESKRGWTTWLTAATGDKRIIGIAPMVFDNLNIGAQMKHQLELWGHYSPMIEAYTKRDLQSKTQTDRGAKLVGMVDPYSYLSLLTMPKFTVNGANDPYWTVDALSLYWNELPGQKSTFIVPNSGHDTGEQPDTMPTVGLFARSCAGGFAWPQPTATWGPDSVNVEPASPFAESVELWTSESSSLNFHESRWVHSATERCTPGNAAKIIVPENSKYSAILVMINYKDGETTWKQSLPIHLVTKAN